MERRQGGQAPRRMSEVKRYSLTLHKVKGKFKSPEFERDNGEWVKFDDYARLKAEVERLNTLCKQVMSQHSDISCENIMLRKAGDAVIADLEHFTKSGWFDKCKSVKRWNAAKDGKLLK